LTNDYIRSLYKTEQLDTLFYNILTNPWAGNRSNDSIPKLCGVLVVLSALSD